jgi:TrmH family RNA methyltransferase
MAAISPAATPSGVVALARRPRPRRIERRGDPLILVAEGVQDPGNVGAMARAAEAAGASELVVSGASADPFGWKALRGSMGSAFRLPIGVCGSVADAIGRARTGGARVVALTVRQGKTLYDADLRGSVALVVGGEGAGLPADAVAAADEAVSIPMAPPVESLNVAVAAGIALYEAARQRRLTREP